jgi:hypothetical protein
MRALDHRQDIQLPSLQPHPPLQEPQDFPDKAYDGIFLEPFQVLLLKRLPNIVEVLSGNAINPAGLRDSGIDPAGHYWYKYCRLFLSSSVWGI